MIFTVLLEQEREAKDKIVGLTKEGIFKDKIVTEVKLLDKFYPAEEYHRDYFERNPDQTYCQLIINPKLKKFKDKWKEFLKA